MKANSSFIFLLSTFESLIDSERRLKNKRDLDFVTNLRKKLIDYLTKEYNYE